MIRSLIQITYSSFLIYSRMFLGEVVKVTSLEFIGSFPAFFIVTIFDLFSVFWYLTHHQGILKTAINGCENEQGNKYSLGEPDRKPLDLGLKVWSHTRC